MRELLEGKVAGPFVVVRVAGYGNFAEPFFANGNARSHDIADVAIYVCVDHVLRRAPDFFQDLAEFFPVLRFAEEIVSVAEATGLSGGPAKGVSFIVFAAYDGAVARDDDAEMFVGMIFYVDCFVVNSCFLPFAIDAVFVRRLQDLGSRCRDPGRRPRCW